jgi:hypothetical protein
MSTINFGKTVSFDETVNLIALCPELKVHVEGEPGIGKSSMLPAIAKKAGIDQWLYIDATQYSTGDGAMPAVNHDTKTSSFYINERFGFHTGKPVVISVDEMSKAMQSVQNELHTLFEERPRFYGYDLPEGSIIYSSGNLSGDGVGDKTKDHTINRQTRVRQRKPTATEWIHNYAVNNDVEGSLIAWCDKNPQAFASYLDEGQEDNHLIFNPRRAGRPFFSPRSAAKASHIIKRRREIGANAMTCALIGTIGEQAAMDISAYIEHQNELPAWRDIIESPRSVHVPSSPAAASVLVFGAVQRVDESSIDAVMQYLERFSVNWQATFCLTLAKSAKQKIGFRNSSFTKWVADNQDLL